MVRYLSNHIGVMYLGKLVEIGTADEVYLRPAHPYTKGLIESAPTADPEAERAKVARGHHRRAAERDPPAVRLPVPHPLPARAGASAPRREPPLRPYGANGHLAACHFALQSPQAEESPPSQIETSAP